MYMKIPVGLANFVKSKTSKILKTKNHLINENIFKENLMKK